MNGNGLPCPLAFGTFYQHYDKTGIDFTPIPGPYRDGENLILIAKNKHESVILSGDIVRYEGREGIVDHGYTGGVPPGSYYRLRLPTKTDEVVKELRFLGEKLDKIIEALAWHPNPALWQRQGGWCGNSWSPLNYCGKCGINIAPKTGLCDNCKSLTSTKFQG